MIYEKEIINKVNDFKFQKLEKNIFSLGGRGYYENPTTDLLSFYINPNEEHQLGDIVLKSFIEAYNNKSSENNLLSNFTVVSNPKREVRTDSGKRIDLVIEGKDSVIILENKIRHKAINPFVEYKEYSEIAYPQKNKIYVLLYSNNNSLVDDVSIKDWVILSYKELFYVLKRNIDRIKDEHITNKWFMFIKDFISNIENEYGEKKVMQEEKYDFVENNYENIVKFKIIYDEYIDSLCLRVKRDLSLEDVKIDNKWGNYIVVLRIYPNLSLQGWHNNTSILLIIMPNGLMKIEIQVYGTNSVKNLRNYIDKKLYPSEDREKSIGRISFRYFESSEVDLIFSEIKNIYEKLVCYHQKSFFDNQS